MLADSCRSYDYSRSSVLIDDSIVCKPRERALRTVFIDKDCDDDDY